MKTFRTFVEDILVEYKSPLQQQKEKNLSSWQKDHPDYKVCPKCKGDGVSVTKARRDYSTCSQCGGSGWKHIGKP